MKIRHDFVTNSSSSSFILAVKNDISYEDFNSFIEELREGLAKHIDGCDWWESNSVDNAVDDAVRLITRCQKYGLNLDGWMAVSGECGNEDSLFGAYIYEGEIPQRDWIKVGLD